jgi:hypothetical protein
MIPAVMNFLVLDLSGSTYPAVECQLQLADAPNIGLRQTTGHS